MPSRLESLQKEFVIAAFGGDSKFTSRITGGGRLTAAKAVGVYKNGWPARASEALGETFECCWRVLGDKDFLDACKAYAKKTPSRSHNLSDYGDSFPRSLEKKFGKSAPFIKNLGDFEWTFKELFHAPPNLGLTSKSLKIKIHKNSVLTFGPSVRLMSFQHRILDLWHRDRADATPLAKKDWQGAQEILMYRGNDSQIFTRELSALEASALRSLMKGRPLSAALESTKDLDPAGATALFTFLSTAGIITEVH